MRKLAYAFACCIAVLAAAPAHAQVAVVLNNDEEVRSFVRLLQAASGSQEIKAGGLEMANLAMLFNNKLTQALQTPRPQTPSVPAPAPKPEGQ